MLKYFKTSINNKPIKFPTRLLKTIQGYPCKRCGKCKEFLQLFEFRIVIHTYGNGPACWCRACQRNYATLARRNRGIKSTARKTKTHNEIKTYRCSRCKKYLSKDSFSICDKMIDKVASRCLECDNQQNKSYQNKLYRTNT